MNQLSEIPDPRQEIRRHVEEMLDPEYVQNTGEANSRVDFIEALDIYLSGTEIDSYKESIGVVGFADIFKSSDIVNELKRKAEERSFDLRDKIDNFLDNSDEDIADEILSFVKEFLE